MIQQSQTKQYTHHVPKKQPEQRTHNAQQEPSVTHEPVSQVDKFDVVHVATFIRSIIRDAGVTGIKLSDLQKQVRLRFRGFKVRDLGYTQFKYYVATLEDIAIEGQGKSVVVRLAD